MVRAPRGQDLSPSRREFIRFDQRGMCRNVECVDASGCHAGRHGLRAVGLDPLHVVLVDTAAARPINLPDLHLLGQCTTTTTTTTNPRSRHSLTLARTRTDPIHV